MSKKQHVDSAEVSPVKAQKTSGKSGSKANDEQGGLLGRFAQFKEYLVLSRAELRKVSWPAWKETRKTSIMVLAFVAVMALLLGVVDFALSGLVQLILS